MIKYRWDLINYLIQKKNYKSYLEIGVGTNGNFNKILASTKRGVDPNIHATLRMTSDEYFDRYSSDNYDIVFIDGLHQYKQCLRDIGNSLKILNNHGSIIIHDCNPSNGKFATEEPLKGTWFGTVWKAILHCRIIQLTPICVVNMDCGCGVINNDIRGIEPFNPNISLDEIDNLPYGYLSEHRKAILNLISIREFEHLYE